MLKYEVLTPHGVFEIIQSLSYGEMIIAILLMVLIIVTGMKFLWEVATREGWF